MAEEVNGFQPVGDVPCQHQNVRAVGVQNHPLAREVPAQVLEVQVTGKLDSHWGRGGVS
ncbi:hypothetical protein GCM10028813_00030 [Ramlibacter alkalitolerans]